jgi:uncharacterized protein
MFPLGTVVFPQAVLSLQVFEPRYLRMIDEALSDNGRFGVVLIERGSEVGGGDTRCDVGTLARISWVQRIGDARLVVAARGERRIRMTRWCPDDPFPRAETTPLDDPAPSERLAPLIDTAVAGRRRLLALASEAGVDVGLLDIDLPSDPVKAAWTICRAVPLGEFDRQRLLETDGIEPRLRLLGALLDAEVKTYRERLAAG